MADYPIQVLIADLELLKDAEPTAERRREIINEAIRQIMGKRRWETEVVSPTGSTSIWRIVYHPGAEIDDEEFIAHRGISAVKALLHDA